VLSLVLFYTLHAHALSVPPSFFFANYCLVLIPAAVVAQPQQYAGGIRTRSLVTSSIDENRLIALAGNTHPAANEGNDLA